ncbi:Extradiol ring-cleavage dioxygenase, class III enzyme, subunit B [Aspergillus venezuelensis]
MQAARANLEEIGREILALSPRSKAIVAFSGHFEAGEIHGPGVIEVNHDFVNDFHDTRPSVYEYNWPRQNAPKLAAQLWQHLRNAGIKAKRVKRGVNHGIWVPFKILTFHGYDLESQLRLGEAIQSLRREGYLVVGSGIAVHLFASIQEIADAAGEEKRKAVRAKVLAESTRFDEHLRNAVTKKNARVRQEALLELEGLYEFRRSHPIVEHFTLLLVATGAARDAEAFPLGVDLIEPGLSYLNLRFS